MWVTMWVDLERGTVRYRSYDDSLNPPILHRNLEALTGDRNKQHSIRINDQWRICFEWRDGHAYEVEIIDYH